MQNLLAHCATAFAGCDHRMAAALAGKIGDLHSNGTATGSAPAQPALSHLETCCAAPDAAAWLSDARVHMQTLPWQEVPPDQIPAAFVGRHAFCRIAGPNGLLPADDFKFGLYLQAPDTSYPPHCHHAEEFYLILSGTALWALDLGPESPIAPGGWSHHAPDQWHATRTTTEPLLALWGWLGDLDFASYRIADQ